MQTNNFRFSKRSEGNLEGVNPALVKVVRRALEITTVDFIVIEGFRTAERQKALKAAGASKTLDTAIALMAGGGSMLAFALAAARRNKRAI